MQVTEVRIKLMDEGGERLQAFCSITFDDAFVIRDLKIIEGVNGPFVAMPSRKLTSHCPQCRYKNHLKAVFCNQCGAKQKEDRSARDDDGRVKLYADIAHPINSACREMIQECVITAFRAEMERAKLPGYVSSYADFDSEAGPDVDPPPHQARRPAAQHGIAERQPAVEAPRQAVQTAEKPRGPHKSPVAPAASQGGAAPHSAKKPLATDFGQGIF